MPTLSERVLARLKHSEEKEPDPWLRDDLRIAWLTVKWADQGVPDWICRSSLPPYDAATFQVLRCLPEQVWPRIVAQRKAKLGAEFALWCDADGNLKRGSSPKKPCASTRTERRSESGKAA